MADKAKDAKKALSKEERLRMKEERRLQKLQKEQFKKLKNAGKKLQDDFEKASLKILRATARQNLTTKKVKDICDNHNIGVEDVVKMIQSMAQDATQVMTQFLTEGALRDKRKEFLKREKAQQKKDLKAKLKQFADAAYPTPPMTPPTAKSEGAPKPRYKHLTGMAAMTPPEPKAEPTIEGIITS